MRMRDGATPDQMDEWMDAHEHEHGGAENSESERE